MVTLESPADGAGNPTVALVRAVRVFPVKGMDAAAARTVRLDGAGVVGDRRHAVVDEAGVLLTADAEPRLRSVSAWLDTDSAVRLDVPGAAPGLGAEAAGAALTEYLGRWVHVTPVDPSRTLDAPVHIVSVQALEAAERGEHEVADCACSLDEPRSNFVVDVRDEAGAAGREEDWIGRRMRIGDAVVEVERKPGHCLGVYAQVVVPGEVQAGDAAVLVP
ncbi:MAG: MOSC N-terminal beta barrel domain-containing protein [Actinobacteria bacterium]|nr:MOSC N-terminal beta barrel domain-containing protein [Actinomycetota bacterium]